MSAIWTLILFLRASFVYFYFCVWKFVDVFWSFDKVNIVCFENENAIKFCFKAWQPAYLFANNFKTHFSFVICFFYFVFLLVSFITKNIQAVDMTVCVCVSAWTPMCYQLSYCVLNLQIFLVGWLESIKMFTSFPFTVARHAYNFRWIKFAQIPSSIQNISSLSTCVFVDFSQYGILLFFSSFKSFPMKWVQSSLNKQTDLNHQQLTLPHFWHFHLSNGKLLQFQCPIIFNASLFVSIKPIHLQTNNFVSNVFFFHQNFPEKQRRSVPGRSMVVGALPVRCLRLSYIPNYSIHSHRVIATQSMHNHCKDINWISREKTIESRLIYTFIYLYITMEKWDANTQSYTTKLLSKIFMIFSREIHS